MKPCIKIQYPTKIDAIKALAEIRQRGDPFRHEKWFYQCLKCKQWHLSSRMWRQDTPFPHEGKIKQL